MIGVFDSGFGGVHVLRGITEALPEYSYLYLGDSARAPYGSRTQDEVYRFTKQGVDFLFAQGATLVVLACNTASSEALRRIQIEYGEAKKVLGVLIPFAEEAVSRSKGKRIGVLATEGTVRSGAYTRELKKLDPVANVFEQACPALVPLVEAGKQHSSETREAIRACVEPLNEREVDTLVLGCTHYGILLDHIREAVGPSVDIISECDVMPSRLRAYLTRHPEVERAIARGGGVHFYTTGDVPTFEHLGSIFYGNDISAKRAELGE